MGDILGVFIDDRGNEIDFQTSIVPLVTEDKLTKRMVFIGTAFFVTAGGLLATAKHCLYHKDIIFENLSICYLAPGNRFLKIPITDASISAFHDVAYLHTKPVVNVVKEKLISYTPLKLSSKLPKATDQLATYGFADSNVSYLESEEGVKYFNGQYYYGKLNEYHPNGFSLLKNPCFQTSIPIRGGASGGPVFDKDGNVFAVCSTGFDFGDGNNEEPVSFVTPLAPTFIVTINTSGGKTTSVNDLINRGEIFVDNINP